MKKSILTSMALAGGLVASSHLGLAQSSPTPAERPTTDAGNVSTQTAPGTTPTPVPSRPAPPSSGGSGSISPSTPPAVLAPLPAKPSDGLVTILPIVPPGGTPRPLPTNPTPIRPMVPGDAVARGVVLAGSPGTTLRAGPPVTTTTGPITVMPLPTNSGVLVFSGDIPRVHTAGVALTPAAPAEGVLAVVQQFDVQRTTELAARSAALEQLRTATPEQRKLIIADLQAAQVTVASEQREIARELRNEMRALREERKGK